MYCKIVTTSSGENLVRLRKSRNLTQRRVAEAIGVTDQAISNWERGKTELRLTAVQWVNLINILQCSPKALVEDLKPSVEGAQ